MPDPLTRFENRITGIKTREAVLKELREDGKERSEARHILISLLTRMNNILDKEYMFDEVLEACDSKNELWQKFLQDLDKYLLLLAQEGIEIKGIKENVVKKFELLCR